MKVIEVPENLSVEEGAGFIRQAMITAGYNPDTAYLLDISDVTMVPVDDTTVVTMNFNFGELK